MFAITAILNKPICNEVMALTNDVYAWAKGWLINITIKGPLLTILKWLINRYEMKLITTRAFVFIPAIKVLNFHIHHQ